MPFEFNMGNLPFPMSAPNPPEAGFTAYDAVQIHRDPVGYLKKVSEMENPSRNTLLAVALDLCRIDQWPLLREAGVLLVLKLGVYGTSQPSPPVLLDAIKCYARCLRLIKTTEQKDVDGHHKAVRDAFNLAPIIFTPAHIAAMKIPNEYSASLREHIRILMHNALEQLCLLADEKHPPARENETIHPAADCTALLRKAVNDSRMYRLCLWVWMTAPDSATRRASDVCRRRLYREDGLRMEEVCFIEDNIPDVAERLDLIISSFEATEDSIAYCIHLLCLYQEKRPTTFCTRLHDGFERDLVNAIWNIMRSSGAETRARIGRPANVILNALLKKACNAISPLRMIMEFQDGASLMARMAVLAAKATCKQTSIFLVDQLLDTLKSPKTKEQTLTAKTLILIARDQLESVWLVTSKHLSELEKFGQHPHARSAIEKWNALGLAVGVSAIAVPLIGCAWYKCPLYQETTEKKMARCNGCRKVQYCNKRCQRSDWKEGGHRASCSPSE